MDEKQNTGTDGEVSNWSREHSYAEINRLYREYRESFGELVAILQFLRYRMERPPLKQWLSGLEVCRYLGISRQSLLRYREQKLIPSYRIKGQNGVRYYYKDVINMITNY